MLKQKTTLKMMTLLLIFTNLACQSLIAQKTKPVFSFGVVADVQYADKDNFSVRHYREALGKLKKIVSAFNKSDLNFVISLGDIIDSSPKNTQRELKAVLTVLSKLRHKLYHTIGNHDIYGLREKAIFRKLGLRQAYYDFSIKNWRIIVLYGFEISEAIRPRSSVRYKKAIKFLKKNPKAKNYQGMPSKKQIEWLKLKLDEAKKQRQKVIVVCHFPAIPEASNKHRTLWNAKEITGILEKSKVVKAYFAGHFHPGGYAEKNGIHHFTFPAVCDAPTGSNSFSIIRVYDDKIQIEGFGTTKSRILKLRK